MIFLTSPGKTYSVNSVSGCTVSVGGTTLVTIPANVQTTFIAPDDAVLLSDNNAIIVEVTGAGADVVAGGSGGEPEGIYVAYGADGSVISCNLTGLTSGDYMFYHRTGLTSFDSDLSSVTNGRYMFYQCTALTSFDSDLSSLTNGSNMFYQCTALTSFDSDLSSLTNGYYMFCDCTNLTSFNSDLSSLYEANRMFYQCTALTSFNSDLSSLTIGDNMFYQCTALTSFTSDLSSLSGGSGMFSKTILDKESALRVLNTIPTHTSTRYLAIGIHIDYQADEEVLAAIAAAKYRGWTVTTQWNGTATASAFALRPTPAPPIYVKSVQEEHGEYVDSNNVRYMIDWGHEIHSPDDKTPEELGYTLFDSLEAALTEWGLTEYVENH